VQACCLHTPFKGEAICEYQVEKHKNPENCPSFGVWKKGMNEGCCFKRVVEMERIAPVGLLFFHLSSVR